MNVNEKGDMAIFKVCLIAAEKGYIVSKPLSESSRYDLVLDDGKKLLKTQVKFADGKLTNTDGSIRVSLEKRYGDRSMTYTSDEIDVLLVYVSKVDKVCVFYPEHFVGKKNLHIRLVPTKNNQTKGCTMLENHVW